MSGYEGTQRPGSTASDFNAMTFLIRSLMGRMATATMVKVVGVTNAGEVGAAGFVDIVPLVSQVAADGTAIPHGTIYRCPYLRVIGGADAVILDPKVGDIGVAVFADRDISTVVATKAAAHPGSLRRFDMSDALYLFGWSGQAPAQYVRFSSAGIEVHSPAMVKISAPDVQISAQTLEITATSGVTITTPTLTLNGSLTATGTVTAPNVVGTTNVTFGGKSGIAHVHSGVQTGSGNTGGPV